MGQDVSMQPFPFSSMKGVVICVKPRNETKNAPKTGEGVVAPSMVCGMTLQNYDEGEPEEVVDMRKLPSDGFKWRKYGRKTVEGQVRHYYRCSSHQGCSAKRHVTWSNSNVPTIVAIGEHEHSEDNSATKKRRIDTSNNEQEGIPCVTDLHEFVLSNAKNHEMVVCVGTLDAVNDGYVWLKTSALNFMCSSIGCSVTKELSQDPLSGFISVKYRGFHCHPKPEDCELIPEGHPTLMDIYNAMVDIDSTSPNTCI